MGYFHYYARIVQKRPCSPRRQMNQIQGGTMVVRGIGCLFLFTLMIPAQNAGTISGTVVDLSGDPVANAVLQATNSETKAVYTATTSAAGVYTLAQLPAGTYQLSN